MHDVAAVAGVSHVTVSRVLNDYPSIRPETRDRVLAAIAQLGYRRNLAARALVTSRSHAIGVLTPAVAQHGPSSSVLAIESAARDLGYHPLVTAAAVDRDATVASLEFLLDQSVEALVVIAPAPAGDRGDPRARHHDPARDAAVARGAHRARRRRRSGRRRHARDAAPGRAGAPRHPARRRDRPRTSRRRRDSAGYLARSRRGPRRAPRCSRATGVRRPGHGLAADARSATPRRVLRQRPDGARAAARRSPRRDARCPASVSVVGFDDIPESAYFRPALTTVHQDFELVGRRVVEVLAARARRRRRRASRCSSSPGSSCASRAVRHADDAAHDRRAMLPLR